jgi:hypothetical protein
MTTGVNQTGASARGDVVGHDKTEFHYHAAASSIGVVAQLLKKLEEEVAQNEEVKTLIETLAHYHKRHSHDGVDGLQSKLIAGGRSSEYLDAIAKKELFVKLLEKWSLYASAQQYLPIFSQRRSTSSIT